VVPYHPRAGRSATGILRSQSDLGGAGAVTPRCGPLAVHYGLPASMGRGGGGQPPSSTGDRASSTCARWQAIASGGSGSHCTSAPRGPGGQFGRVRDRWPATVVRQCALSGML
jgi:hypothetical protein